jgi:aminoglycoside 6-adenylyltransferase
LTLFAWHARAGDPELDTWHEARFFERWGDPRAVEALRASYARYDADEVGRAVAETMDAFERFERETAGRLGFRAPSNRGPVRSLVQAVLADSRGR